MPTPTPDLPPDLLEKLSNLDLSNPEDLNALMALSPDLCNAAGLDPDTFSIPSGPEEQQPTDDLTPAYLAAANPQIPLPGFISIVDEDPHQIVNSQTLLFPACLLGARDKVGWLLEQGVDPNHADDSGYTPLIYAALPGQKADLNLLILLLENGANADVVSRHDESPLRILIREGNYEAASLFLTPGIDDPSFSALHQACAYGEMEMVHALLTPETLEQQNHWKRTPWLTALHAGQPKVAEFLESQGANTTATGHMGDTGLHLAAESNASRSVQYLLDRGHDLDARGTFGNTPLHNAVEADSARTTRLLLEAGADVHALTQEGDAPINFADSVPVLRLLAAHGADLNRPNCEGLRPFDHFAEHEDLSALFCLLEQGADLQLLDAEARDFIMALLSSPLPPAP